MKRNNRREWQQDRRDEIHSPWPDALRRVLAIGRAACQAYLGQHADGSALYMA